ncbi:tetraspanin-33-like [Gigantopelta aegis]|uniref:tetraspanin-33-like n=1 Tax=Gigantopelta aegis TaxID=1735272 RepID=UPI001B8887D6|nr:tetraspanin-33-like [Gigantopelta aegis]
MSMVQRGSQRARTMITRARENKRPEDSVVSLVVKYLLFAMNFLCWLIGGVMVGTGIWAYIEKNKYYHVQIQHIYDVFFDLSIIFLVLGLTIWILGFAGCLGALRENICLLKFYYIIIFIILFLELTVCIMAFLFRSKTKEIVTGGLNKNLISRYDKEDPDVKDFIDFIQENIECCGVTEEGYLDWNTNKYYNCTEKNRSALKCMVPHSCCINQFTISEGTTNLFCSGQVLDLSNSAAKKQIHTIGCIDKMLILGKENLPFMGGIVLAVIFPQLLAVYLARKLESQIRDQMGL